MIDIDRLLTIRLQICCLVFLLFSGVVQAQTVTVTSPTDSLEVGETFEFAISYKSTTTYDKVIFPDSTLFGADLGFRSMQQYKLSDYADSTVYELQFFALDEATIAPLPLRVISAGDTTLLFTEAVVLNQRSVLASAEDPLKPSKPIFEFPITLWPWILGLLLLAAIAYFLYQKYVVNKEEEPVQEVIIPEFQNPLNELEQRLRALKTKHDDSIEKDYKTFYSELGDALRWYIEEVYKIPALESTTREVIRFMDAFGMDIEMLKHTREILKEADMAKFAKFKPTYEQSLKAYHLGHSFLERARQVDIARIQRLRDEFEAQFQTIQTEEADHGMG